MHNWPLQTAWVPVENAINPSYYNFPHDSPFNAYSWRKKVHYTDLIQHKLHLRWQPNSASSLFYMTNNMEYTVGL